jgi:hypothetical protein
MQESAELVLHALSVLPEPRVTALLRGVGVTEAALSPVLSTSDGHLAVTLSGRTSRAVPLLRPPSLSLSRRRVAAWREWRLCHVAAVPHGAQREIGRSDWHVPVPSAAPAGPDAAAATLPLTLTQPLATTVIPSPPAPPAGAQRRPPVRAAVLGDAAKARTSKKPADAVYVPCVHECETCRVW